MNAYSIRRMTICSLFIFTIAGPLVQAENTATNNDQSLRWGVETNGYCGGVKVAQFGKEFDITVYARQPVQANPPPPLNTNIIPWAPRYLINPNWVPGPMKLSDPNGHEVPSLHPERLALSSFPVRMSWKELLIHDIRNHPYYSGPPPGTCGFSEISDTEREGQLKFFRLGEYFQLKEPGEYQFTIWPKIYKQSQTNYDTYERIDLPPVTIPIQWTDGQSAQQNPNRH